nr:ATP synthase F0 subunit 9 [Rhizopus arrhizus]AAW49476.1 ATP synthase F0 subunit 9 [Rhizopus arrhizus]
LFALIMAFLLLYAA